jgi:uncharacterized membrane protein YbhN (UPF0104 family)
VLSIGLLVVPWLVHTRPQVRALVQRVPLVSALIVKIAAPRRPWGIGNALLLSFATQGLSILIAELLLFRIADATELVAAARMMPFAILLSYVPITPGAVLQREAVYTVFLGLAGISADRAVAVSILSFSVQLTVAAIGGAIYAGEKVSAPA